MALRRPSPESLILAALQLVALGWVASSLLVTSGFPLDDAWIHQVVARNLATRGVYGVTPGAHSSGTSSLLWTLLLALGQLLRAPPVAWTLALNAALYLAFGQWLLRAARDDGMSPPRALALAAVATCTGNVAWFALSGMEATLLCALSAAAVSTWFSAAPVWRSALPLSLLAVTRPDALALPALLALRHRSAGRSRADAMKVVAAPMVTFTAWVALNLRLLGTALPSTLAGRRWLNNLGAPPYGLRSLRWVVRRWPMRLGEYTLGTANAVAITLAMGVVAVGVAALVRDRRHRLTTLAAWSLAHVLTFAVLFPVTGHGGRYQPLVPSLFLPLALAGLWALAEAATKRLPRPPARLGALVAAPVALVAALSLARWSAITESGVAHIEHTERAMGEWIRDHLPREARVATFDLGAITYFSGRDVLDLGGLVDPALAPILQRGEVASYMSARGVTHVVIPVGHNDRHRDGLNMGYRLALHGNPTVRLTPVHREVTPWELWYPAALPTGHASPQQALYRFEHRPAAPHWGSK